MATGDSYPSGPLRRSATPEHQHPGRALGASARRSVADSPQHAFRMGAAETERAQLKGPAKNCAFPRPAFLGTGPRPAGTGR
jgi:hypothetical protein